MCVQDNVDDTLVLKERLASVGGLSAFQAEAGTSLGLALHAIEPVLSKVPTPTCCNIVASNSGHEIC